MKVKSSGIQAAAGAIVAHECFFCGYSIVTDAEDDVLLTVYDNASAASGTVVGYAKCSDESLTVHEMFPYPIWCANGIYADLDAAEGDYIIYYALGQ